MSKVHDAYATMLLTMALSANREEYVRPYSVGEFEQLCRYLSGNTPYSLGDLLEKDIGTLMYSLFFTQEEAYRIYTLLHREVQLQYALESFAEHGISCMTRLDEPKYPPRLNARLKSAAPPFLYYAGNVGLCSRPLIAIIGISGIRTSPELRESIVDTVKSATKEGYGIMTGGELGVSRIAADAAKDCGGFLVDVLGGAMIEHVHREPICQMLREDRALVLCAEHPEAMFTVTHAIARNKTIFALSDAALICNTDNKRGEIDALNNHTCDWIYAWTGCPGNQALIRRGAIPIRDFRTLGTEEMTKRWRYANAVQLSFFDEGEFTL